MYAHQFIFAPGNWIGEGNVSFSTSTEKLHFYTKWIVRELEDESISCEQTVEMQGANEHVTNHFLLTDITSDDFLITLENDMLGQVTGKGVVDESRIAWEFRGGSGLEGFETFKLQEGGEYLVHSEYASQDHFRSIIDAKIWRKKDED